MQTVAPGFYYHYKHTADEPLSYAYEVLNIAHHTEIDDFEQSSMVVYRPLYKTAKVYQAGKHWDVRPLSMFLEDVTKEGKTFPRFSRVVDPETVALFEQARKELYGE